MQKEIDFKTIFLDSIGEAAERHLGSQSPILAMDMVYADAVAAMQWPVLEKDGKKAHLNWISIYKRRQFSSRHQSAMLVDEYERPLAGVKMGVTRYGDRLAITHMSRDLSDGQLQGRLAQIAYSSLLIAREQLNMKHELRPNLAILNPLKGALPHYQDTAEEMGLSSNLVVAGKQSLLYIDYKKTV